MNFQEEIKLLRSFELEKAVGLITEKLETIVANKALYDGNKEEIDYIIVQIYQGIEEQDLIKISDMLNYKLTPLLQEIGYGGEENE